MVSISQQGNRPHAEPPRDPGRYRWASLFVVCVGVMMAFVNSSSTISALPPIQDDLHVSGSTLVWVTSAFTLAVASLVMSAGTAGELYGRRRMYFIGVVLFAAGSLLAFLSDSAGILITAQVVMGVGAAAVLPSGLAIVSTTFHDPRERTGAISIWASTAGLGLALGPIIAGFLLDHYSWNTVYLTNVVLGVLAAVFTLIFVSEGKHPTRQLDPVGMVLVTLTIAAATYAIIEGGAIGYGEAPIVIAYVLAAVGLAAFILVELRHHDPMLDLRLFRSASFTTVMLLGATAMFGFVGIALLTVLYLERVAGVGALETGFQLLPLCGSYVLVSAAAAHVIRRVGFTVTLGAGLAFMGVGSCVLLWAGPFSGYSALWPGLLVVGIGSGLLVAPSTAAAINSVTPTQAGMASATVNMFRQLGLVLGPSILGTIATSNFPKQLTDELTSAGVPAETTRRVVENVGHGHAPGVGENLSQTVSEAIPSALTSAIHQGWLTGGIVLLVMVIPTALFVRHRHPDMVPTVPDGVRS